MSYVLLVVACLTGQPPVSQFGECLEHHLPLSQITNVTARHLGGRYARMSGSLVMRTGVSPMRSAYPTQKWHLRKINSLVTDNS
jgi:hypothetical protein